MTRPRPSPVCVVAAMAMLSACTSTDVLEPSAIAADSRTTAAGSAATASVSTPAQAPAGTTSTTDRSTATAALPAVSRLQFAPIIGTPVEAAAPLTERLALRARERGIAIAPSGEPQTYVRKGYFSALPEGKETTVVYVWDVLDSSGNRLHRIGRMENKAGEAVEVAPGSGHRVWIDLPPEMAGAYIARIDQA